MQISPHKGKTLAGLHNDCACDEDQKWNCTIQTGFAFPVGKQTGTTPTEKGATTEILPRGASSQRASEW